MIFDNKIIARSYSFLFTFKSSMTVSVKTKINAKLQSFYGLRNLQTTLNVQMESIRLVLVFIIYITKKFNSFWLLLVIFKICSWIKIFKLIKKIFIKHEDKVWENNFRYQNLKPCKVEHLTLIFANVQWDTRSRILE